MKKTSLLFAATLLAAPAFAQDECSGAVTLVAGAATPFDTGLSTASATPWTCALGGGPDTWFTYTTTATSDVEVSTCNNATYDTAIEIFSGDCANLNLEVCNDDGPGCLGFSSLAVANAVPMGTTLYIRVGGYNGASGTGSVTLTELPASCLPDMFEDNDDCGTAVAIVDGTYPGLNVADVDNDYYSVTVANGATLDASIAFLNGNGDVDLYLWDPLVACDTNVVGQGTGTGALVVGFSASDDENISYTNNSGSDQNLIIEVDMFSAGACNDYDLTVTGAGMGGPGPIGVNYCMANNNATGVPGVMSGFGQTSIGANDITVTASDLPLNQFGIFVVSDTQGFVPNAGGTSNGNICLGGVIGRYQSAGQILSSGATGSYSLTINVNTIPQGGGILAVSAGTTVNFQSWHREPVGQGSNFTDGLEIVLSN